MRFKKTKEKYSRKPYWIASFVNRGQLMKDIFWLIYPSGGGFNLFRVVDVNKKKTKICHVSKFDSAKTIANLMQNG